MFCFANATRTRLTASPTSCLAGAAAAGAYQDGSFQCSARFRGPDLDSATPAELIGTTVRLNSALRRLGSGWAILSKRSAGRRRTIRRVISLIQLGPGRTRSRPVRRRRCPFRERLLSDPGLDAACRGCRAGRELAL